MAVGVPESGMDWNLFDEGDALDDAASNQERVEMRLEDVGYLAHAVLRASYNTAISIHELRRIEAQLRESVAGLYRELGTPETAGPF